MKLNDVRRRLREVEATFYAKRGSPWRVHACKWSAVGLFRHSYASWPTKWRRA